MEQLKHECGVAMIRLLKPLDYFEKKYGTWAYGFNKLYLMMEKQHNRGQEGAGLATVCLNKQPGTEYMFREKAEGKNAITEIFSRVTEEMAGELYMGHLRYSTTGKSGLTFVHPFLRRNNWRAKNLCLCGNFNMTNIDEVFDFLTAQGQSPRIYGDSYITLELMGHRLDREVERLFTEAKEKGLEGIDITNYIDDNVEMANVLKTTMIHYDGGYVMCGLTGSGEMFAVRDPWGIRPAFFYRDEELIALASERPVLQTTFDVDRDKVVELKPGQALIVHKNGDIKLEQILGGNTAQSNGPLGSAASQGEECSMVNVQYKYSACSFERIYFSRGSDCDIYQERKRLGEQLTPAIMKAIDGDVDHTVFSYIPNTAEVAYYGMTDGVRKLHGDVRTEKVVWKDIKLRTFISANTERNDLAAHVYDISYGSLTPNVDNLVIIDDSIVRGTTLKESIFKILDRLHPKRIVMVSSSPQIRYPDYYGIDMARLEEFCAFRATMALIEERGMWQLVNDTYLACKRELQKPKEEMENCVRAVYAPFTVEEINNKIVEMLRPADMQAPIELVFQSIEGLHEACPNHPGDWYFTGHYPTPGGNRLVNQAFINYIESKTSANK
ncbi:amidophosphoribosyltransferase [Xylanibacter ruminicola]|uniref:Amidophosphoribosyltransferase n=1 Tax=Xylanibacter ruminicola TaxID=839 RepID=A0A1M6UQ09_XYLRU|nr:amidophosphoribosyltransferase [Xylanibacter ruminicola]SHK71256.1 amidophosphoribosyltransferase [Xylanibacter ruminicola]